MNLFVVRDVIHTLIHLLRGGGLLVDPVGHFFGRFCTMILPSRSGELSKFLGVIVSSLVPLACQNTKVLNLLTTLVVKNEVHLYEAIKLVDPFPPDPEFLPLREVYCRIKYAAGPFSLDDEVKQFLGVASGHLGCRVEGLHHLRKQVDPFQ
uniref:Uncharacterized protein n=1 Tax=Timema monikensis TaxID=170555 RepID=A0A7R9EMD2_9NEOP|nr:unnamed protein product [Timema monikensis]